MKKWIKGLTIAGVIMLCAGTGITAMAAAAGGARMSTMHGTFPTSRYISRIVERSTHGILGYSGMNWGNNFKFDYDDQFDDDYDKDYDKDYDDDNYDSDYMSDYNYSTENNFNISTVISPKEEMVLAATYKGVKKLDLEVKASCVKVVENPDLKDEIAIYVKEKERTGIRHNLKGDASVSVEYYTNNRDPYKNGIYGEGIIEIPAGYRFNEAEMSVEAGELEITSIAADSLSLSSQAGNLYVTAFKAGRLSADAEAAGIKASGEVTSVLEVDAEAAAVELMLSGSKEDFSVTLDNSLGTVSFGDDTFTGVSTQKSYNSNSAKKADLDCSAGTIKIDFTN